MSNTRRFVNVRKGLKATVAGEESRKLRIVGGGKCTEREQFLVDV